MSERRKVTYISKRLASFKKRFGHIVDAHVPDESTRVLVYSIMIFEAFNRPKIGRWAENLLILCGVPKTAGIMQVKTSKLISDEESVEIAVQKIIRDLAEAEVEMAKQEASKEEQRKQRIAEHDRREKLRLAIAQYNGGSEYYSEIINIYDELTDPPVVTK